MPPQKSQISCPRCRQPIMAQVEQLFDVSADPGAKQRLLGGISNYVVCPACGFNGPLATPIVYHDANKELLLTYFPPELSLPVNEQEKLIGPLINQLVNRLPPEKRKAYLLQPQSFLTYQSLIERILGADGITPEMLQAQQQKVGVIERLLSASTPEARSELIKQEGKSIDADFFALFGRLLESAAMSRQEGLAAQMDAIQKQLLEETEYGRKITVQANEIQEAVKTLQSAGKELNRDKLLDILIDAPNEDRLNALVSLTRPALDYIFFQTLSERIEKKSGAEREKLESLREELLEITKHLDQRVEEEFKRSQELLDSILAADDIQKSTLDNLGKIGDIFIQVLNLAIQEATKNNDQQRLQKLQQIVAILQKTTAPPPELNLLEELLDAQEESALNKLLEQHAQEITPEFSSIIANVMARTEEQAGKEPGKEQAQLIDKLSTIYRATLKFTMKKSMEQ